MSMASNPELTREESAWLLALARDRVREFPEEFSIPDTVRYSLLAKGCISLGSPLQLTALGLAVIAQGMTLPTDAEGTPRAPVFFVSVDLPKREAAEESAAAPPSPDLA